MSIRYKQDELEQLVSSGPYDTRALCHVDDIRGMQHVLRVLTGKGSFLVPDGQGAEMYYLDRDGYRYGITLTSESGTSGYRLSLSRFIHPGTGEGEELEDDRDN